MKKGGDIMLLTTIGSLFVLGFAIGITMPMVDHAEAEKVFWNDIVAKYEGSGSK